MKAAAASLAEQYVGERELNKLERGRDAAEFSAAKKSMAEETHRALGAMVVQAKGASAAAAASRYACTRWGACDAKHAKIKGRETSPDTHQRAVPGLNIHR